MKQWVLPAAAAAAVVFLMTRPGRKLQDRVKDSFGDWGDTVLRAGQRLQETLGQVETTVGRFNRAWEKVSD